VDVIGLLTVGFPAESPAPRPRKPLCEIVHYDVFGKRIAGGEVSPGRPPGGWLVNLLRRARFTIRPGSTSRRPGRRETD